MQQIIRDLWAHLRADFSVKSYGSIGLLLAFMLFMTHYYDIEQGFLAYLGWHEYMAFIFALFFFTYHASVLIKCGTAPYGNRAFVVYSTLVLSVASVSSSLLFVRSWTQDLDAAESLYLTHLLYNSLGSVIVFTAFALLYSAFDRKHMATFYGLSLKGHNLKPYFLLLVFMFPVILWAAMQPHFTLTYPIFRTGVFNPAFGMDLTQMAALFETAYLFDFLRVELLFRGVLVIGMVRFLGKDSILPMAALYCMLHINKPLGEAISSFFGGYLLGTIAYYQRHITGGIIVHVGIAGMMEALAWLL